MNMPIVNATSVTFNMPQAKNIYKPNHQNPEIKISNNDQEKKFIIKKLD